MNKIIRIIIIIVLSLLVVIITNYKHLYYIYKINQIENDIIDISNGKFNNRTYPNNVKVYERFHKSLTELNHNMITELIDEYINNVIIGMNIYIENNEEVVVNKNCEYKEINKYKDVEIGKDVWMRYCVIKYAVGESFTSYDVKNYEDGTFRDVLVKELKNCLDYKEQGNTIEWYINSIEDKRIELPYNCYIDYKAYHREDNEEFKKVIAAKIKGDIDFSKESQFSYGYPISIKYETISNNFKEKEVELRRIKKMIKSTIIVYIYMKEY